MVDRPSLPMRPSPASKRLRALATGPRFWLAMFAASALGTNLGDVWADQLGLPGWVSFGCLVALSLMTIVADLRFGRRTEAAYWFAIVVLRAAATNVADFLTEYMSLGYLLVMAVLAVLALVAGTRTKAGSGVASPVIGGWYWVAMFLAGVFGTAGGDLASHSIGVFAAAGALTALLLILLALRERWFPVAMLSYWVVVLAERGAGTPVGDSLASRRGMGLGPSVAAVCTTALFAAALAWRGRQHRARQDVPNVQAV